MTRMMTAVVALALVASCSDFTMAPDREPAALQIAPDTVVVTAGDSVAFDFTVLDQDGEPFDAIPSWAVPVWTYSTPSVLEVGLEGTGRTVAAGEVDARAELAGLEATSVVRVNPEDLTVTVGFVHVTQSVQRPAGDVPLVAGREGLLRVYLLADGPNFFDPAVTATFYQDGVPVHTDTLASEDVRILEEVEATDLTISYDAVVPGSVLQPGVSLVVEVDPEGVVPATSTSELRYPEVGELALDVVEVPPFRVRLVPVNQSMNGMNSTLDATSGPPLLTLTEDLYPMAGFDADVRTPYTTAHDLTTQDGWVDLLYDIAYLRQDDGSPRYYYGGFRIPPGAGWLGLGFVGYPASIGSETHPSTIAHELGHNLDLPHAPCGLPSNPDPDYPYAAGLIGQVGYDRTRYELRDPDETYDLMTYCDPVWVSDYNYERIMAYRDTSSFDSAFWSRGAASRAPAQHVAIVTAGVHDGALRIGPVLESAAPPSLPVRDGPYTLEGLDDDGAAVFSVSFEPYALDHDVGAMFSAAVPLAPEEVDRVATLRLTGPEGVAERARGAPPPTEAVTLVAEDAGRPGVRTLRWDTTAYPMAVVRDRATGQIVAMSTTGRLTLADPGAAAVSLSDGVGTHPVVVEPR